MPGSTHSFRATEGGLKLSNCQSEAYTGQGCLCVYGEELSLQEEVKVYLQTYYRPDDFNDSRYDPAFSPLIYPGQTIECALKPDADILCRIYVLDDNSGEELEGDARMLKRGQWTCLKWKTGHAIIQRDMSGQNCIVLFGGANRKITAEHIESALSGFSHGDYLILQNEINGISDIITRAKNIGMRVVLNPSPLDEAVLSLPLDKVDIFMLNGLEAEGLCGACQPDDMMRKLKEKFPKAEIVLTLGKLGVMYQAPHMKEPIRHGIYDVTVVDTTAAGDTFTGFFIACVSKGHDAYSALETASKASSLAVSKKGAEPSIPNMAEVLSCTVPRLTPLP